MRKFFLPVFFVGMLVLVFLTASIDIFSPSNAAAQDAVTTTPQIEITGVTATELPDASITANVVDTLGQPVAGLTAENFTLSGALADVAQIVSVENITADNLPFSVVLVVDTSSSMAGTPLTKSQEAAVAFIDALRDEDSVAVIGFNDDVQVYQDFTTDRDALRNAITTIPFGGETALYEAALVGVQTAVNAPTERRVVILLSDGAEYGNTSNAARPDAGELARAEGVPVYAIGLGFGTDRTYLEELSSGTNARFEESPTPEELTAIYEELAALLRSLYVITLDVDVPADGTEYAFDLQATTPEGDTNVASSVLRAPVPIPVVRLDEVPTELLIEPFALTATILADDEIASVAADINGETVEIVELTRTPLNGTFAVQIDPFSFPPGDITVNVSATDNDGESGSASATLVIGAVPARLTLGTDLSTLGEIAEPVEVAIVAEGQTPPSRVVFTVDGEEVEAVDVSEGEPTQGFSFTIDPFSYASGEHTLGIEVTSASGAVSTLEGAFSVAALPPQVTFTGINAGDVISEPVSFDLSVTGQAPITEVALYGADTVIGESSGDGDNQADVSFTIDPADHFPGGLTLTVVITDANGQTTSLDVPVEIAALPPTFTVTGIEDGAVVGDRIDISVQVDEGQTQGLSVVTTMNDNPHLSIEQLGNTFSFGLNPLNFDPETDYTLGITVTNEGGASSSQEFTLSFDPAFYITLTPEPTVDVQATVTLWVAQTLQAQATVDAQATAEAANAANVVATTDAQSTAEAMDVSDAETATAIQVTRDWFATAAAQATVDAQGTADIRTAEGQSTLDALEAQNADSTATAAVEQSTLDALATENAEATNDLIAMTEDAAAQIQITQQQATVNAQATRESAVTANALAATLTAQPTETPEPTEISGQTQGTTEATEDATVEPTEEVTEEPTVEPTEEATEEPTEAATIAPTNTEAVEPTATIFDPTATPIEPTDIEAQDAPQADNTALLVALACGGLLVVLLLIWFFSRRNRGQ